MKAVIAFASNFFMNRASRYAAAHFARRGALHWPVCAVRVISWRVISNLHSLFIEFSNYACVMPLRLRVTESFVQVVCREDETERDHVPQLPMVVFLRPLSEGLSWAPRASCSSKRGR